MRLLVLPPLCARRARPRRAHFFQNSPGEGCSAVCDLRSGDRVWLKSNFARPQFEHFLYPLLAVGCWLLAVAVTGDKGQETLCDHGPCAVRRTPAR